jgi:hypothetical protein
MIALNWSHISVWFKQGIKIYSLTLEDFLPLLNNTIILSLLVHGSNGPINIRKLENPRIVNTRMVNARWKPTCSNQFDIPNPQIEPVTLSRLRLSGSIINDRPSDSRNKPVYGYASGEAVSRVSSWNKWVPSWDSVIMFLSTRQIRRSLRLRSKLDERVARTTWRERTIELLDYYSRWTAGEKMEFYVTLLKEKAHSGVTRESQRKSR